MDNTVIELPFGIIEIANKCVIHTANEGVDIGHEELEIIGRIVKENTEGDISYISNQINDYSISAVHLAIALQNLPTIKHLAFVYYKQSRHTALQSVLRLLPENMLIKTFDNLADAMQWVEKCNAKSDSYDSLTSSLAGEGSF